jgi:hypothetical protein
MKQALTSPTTRSRMRAAFSSNFSPYGEEIRFANQVSSALLSTDPVGHSDPT